MATKRLPRNVFEMLERIDETAQARIINAFLLPHEQDTTNDMEEVKQLTARIVKLLMRDIDRSYDHMYGRKPKEASV